MTQIYTVNLMLEDVAATTPYVLVDLSDTTNFSHHATDHLTLVGLRLVSEKVSDGAFTVKVGVVLENDDTDGSVQWIHSWFLETTANSTDSTDRFVDSESFVYPGVRPDGLPLRVVSGALENFVGNDTQDDSANWQNDQARTSPVGTSNPGVGDLVMLITETADGGTISLSLTVDYSCG